jgi:ABC-2 type transport system permease protein
VRWKYAALARMALQNAIAYRGAYLAQLAGAAIGALAPLYLLHTIYLGRDVLGGLAWDDARTYVLVGFAVNTLISWYSETQISSKVLDGSVVTDLTRPLDFQSACLAETLGVGLVEGGVALLAMVVLVASSSGLAPPRDGLTAVLFAVSVAASVLIKFGIVFIASLVCFWTSNARGVAWARAAITGILSGAVVPLPLLPEPVRDVVLVLPFQGIVHTPALVYLGRLRGSEAIASIARQIGWAIALWFVGRALFGWAVRRITIHGG